MEGIILDENDDENQPELLSGFDLVMGLGSTVEDTGLDLVRGNNESSDDEEKRRLRKLNQESLTMFQRVQKIQKFFVELFLKYLEIFFGISVIDFYFSTSRKVVVIGETDVRIQCVHSIALEIF